MTPNVSNANPRSQRDPRFGAFRALTLAVAIPAVGAIAGCGGQDAEGASPALTSTTIASTGATNPTVAVAAADGETYVAWVAVRDGESNVLLSGVSPSGAFAEPVRVNDIPGDAAPHAQAPAQVATGPGNEVYVVWQNVRDVEFLDFGASDVRFARSSDGGATWEPAITVNDNLPSEPARNTFHNITVAGDGTIFVSWIDARVRDAYRGEVFRETGKAADPATEPGTEVRVAKSTDGGRSFSPSVAIESNSCPCCRTATAVGPDGTVYVSYRKIYEGNIRDIVVARSTDGGETFGEPVRVHEDNWHIPGCPHAGASLAVDGEGRLHVAWFTGADDDPGAFYTVSTDQGLTFAEPTRLTGEGPLPTSLATVAADDAGTVWVAWEDIEGDSRRIALAQVLEDGRLARVDLGSPPGATPAIAAADPAMALAWQDGGSIKVVRGE